MNEKQPGNIIKSNSNRPPKFGSRRKQLLVIFAILVAAAAGFLWYVNNYSDKKEAKNVYSYKQLEKQTLDAPTGGSTGISVTRPIEFKETVKQSDKDYSVKVFTHINDEGNSLGFLSLFTRKNELAGDKQRLEGMNRLFAQGDKEDYEKEVASLMEHIKSYIHKDYVVELGEAQPFTNDSIRSNAWIFNVTAKSTTEDENRAPLEGRFVFGVSKDSYYYLTFLTLASNWTDNSEVFRQTIKSFEVN